MGEGGWNYKVIMGQDGCLSVAPFFLKFDSLSFRIQVNDEKL